jgi:protein-S-isoprenylcysteine O-methyltransferase Ste14
MAPIVMGGMIPWWLTRWQSGPDVPAGRLLSLLGWCGVIVGTAAVIEAFVRFVRRGRGTPAPYDPAVYLVASGSYRYVRNPMYVGMLMLVIGQALILRRTALVWYSLALGLAFHLRIILHEEPFLERRFGESYREYCRHVRRWVPRVRARK